MANRTSQNEGQGQNKIHASPTKDFFIRMITRDITLIDCIFDLLDNCLDGAARSVEQLNEEVSEASPLDGYSADISFSRDTFTIKDNCGGIPLSEAIDYAFHFGRRADAPRESDHSIGLYGIGLKRAIFKIGNGISIQTYNANDSYAVKIDVGEWAGKEDWDFEFDEADSLSSHGTEITISKINDEIAEEFEDQLFLNEVTKAISRDYSIFLQNGFKVSVNNQNIPPYIFGLKVSDEFIPINKNYVDETGVSVSIVAGAGGSPPDDTSSAEMRFPQTEYWGWYVICNDRVVIAGNKDDKTVWGDSEFPGWHPQYNGFIGIVSFRSSDPNLLPWTTTKREIDPTVQLYRRALVQMKDATRPFLDYTNERKENIELAKTLEKSAELKPVRTLAATTKMSVPRIAPKKPSVRMTTISYRRPDTEVKRVAQSLGNRNATNKFVGEKTFEYYCEQELEEE